MRKHIRCGKLFTGLSERAETDQTIIVKDERIALGPPETASVGG